MRAALLALAAASAHGLSATPRAPPAAADPWLTQALAVRRPAANGLASIREEASAALAEARRPGRKDEAWRRTDLSSLFAATLAPPAAHPDAQFVAQMLDDNDNGTEEAQPSARLVFVDGVVDAELSELGALPAGAYAGPIAGLGAVASDDVVAAVIAAVRELPEQGADHRTELGCYTFSVLNQAALADVTCIYLPRGVKVTSPIRLLHLSSGGANTDALPTSHPNVVVWMEEQSEMLLMQQYCGTGAYFTNGLTRIRLDANASLAHAYVQEQSSEAVHIDSVLVRCDAGARYDTQVVQSGGRIARVNLGVELAGPHATTSISGISLANDGQLSDLHSAVRHASRDCVSGQEQRNAVAGRARVVFRGAVQVPLGADNTTANQLCRSLLLSDRARVDVSPNLEILTDDVQCTHGATVADLDDEMIFYLQSRGLSRAQARVLILAGWARSVMDKVPSAGAVRRVSTKAAELAEEGAARQIRKGFLSSI